MLSRRHWLLLLPLLALRWLLRSWWPRDNTILSNPVTSTGYQDGDEPKRAHRYLRDSNAPTIWKSLPIEQTQCIVVGGGLAGLIGAEQLGQRPCVLLEQARCFGGHSRSILQDGRQLSLAAAYINMPTAQTPVYDFLAQLQLLAQLKPVPNGVGDMYFQGQKWQSIHSESQQHGLDYLHHLIAWCKDAHQEPTNLPPLDKASYQLLQQRDGMSLSQYLTAKLGVMPPWCQRWLDCYCLSTFAGRSEEVSAAQGLAFLQADLNGIGVLPGGNGAITRALLAKLEGQANVSLRSQALVRTIEVHPNHVDVLYHNRHEQLQRLRAPTCLLAVPKFVAKRLVSPLPTDQLAAMAQIQYRAYLVANVRLPQQAAMASYDGFWLPATEQPQIFQDVIHADFGQTVSDNHTYLTLYCPMPAAQSRLTLLAEASAELQRAALKQQLAALLAAKGLGTDTIGPIHLTKWGHALPLPTPGLLANNSLPTAHQPVQERLFFSQQDNWCAPAFEAVYDESRRQAQAIEQVLAQ